VTNTESWDRIATRAVDDPQTDTVLYGPDGPTEEDLRLVGDVKGKRVVDLGCGRGAVLTAVARRLPRGHATGVDLWRSVDQSGNSPAVTSANAAAEGVRVSLDTADMTSLPYPDESFDLVVSSMAIHNIHPAAGRLTAVDEALRVLRPGGHLAIADISAAPAYAKHLAERGLTPAVRPLGWRMWWGGPWLPTVLVTARADRIRPDAGTRPEPARPPRRPGRRRDADPSPGSTGGTPA